MPLDLHQCGFIAGAALFFYAAKDGAGDGQQE
jgi:hypothetical protein